jgi:dTDP-D-glucose 4,6-dehydratase
MLSEVSDHRRVITQIVHKTQTGEGIYNAVANKDNNGVSLPID